MRFATCFQLLWLIAFSATAAPGPNVIFIAVDDLRPELGCYGAAHVHSPHIDRFAASAVRFERAYCQVAVCNPSRVSLLTGLRPDTSRVWDLVTRFRHTVPAVVTLPQHFKQHGYHAVSFGKIFHNPWPDNASWSEPHAWPKDARLWSDAAKARLRDFRAQMKADGRSEAAIRRMRAPATEIVDLPDGEHIDGAIADQAIAALKRLAKRQQPFFLAAGFVRPHLPFVVPRKYWDLYDREKIPLAANEFLPRGAPGFAMNTMYELRDYMDYADTPGPFGGTLTEAQRRELKHGYLASVSLIDAQVGRLLDELERLKLADNTIVVLWSDHGWKLGEHNSWCKQTNHEIDTRVPLLIRAPGARANGSATRSFAELLDLYPTLCELAGLSTPKHVEGVSLKPVLEDPAARVRDAAFSQFRRRDGKRELMGYAMRTEQSRYVEWLDRGSLTVVARELYDHRDDAGENENIAEAVREKARELSRALWAALPRPQAVETSRPRLTIRNESRQPVTVYWARPDGDPRQVAEVAVGGSHMINTTLGHRFVIRGQLADFEAKVTVKQAEQTFTLRAGHRKLPNIVVFMADDWSSPHAGILGDPVAKTPHFDRIAREGTLFKNAFVSTPSCTPSRLSILTGQHHWRLQEGDSLGGSLRKEFPVYPDLLAGFGYRVGRYGKGVWPSKHSFRKRDSFGKRYGSFDEFLKDRKEGEPFCFWFGGQDPHRPYEQGVGARDGIDLRRVQIPECLPEHPVVRSDLADYHWEVARFDRQVGAVLKRLEELGELEDTLIVVSGDNGMPFPGAKATLRDLGTHVPLAIRWGNKQGGRVEDALVSLCDLAPTILRAAGLKVPKDMTGRSLLPLLGRGEDRGERDAVLTGLEQHVYPWPARAIRTKEFLYIRHFAPAAWRSGQPAKALPRFDFSREPWPTMEGAFAFNSDPSPTKQVLRLEKTNADVAPFAEHLLVLPPDEELYDLRTDPGQMSNLAGRSEFAAKRNELSRNLSDKLRESGDPRFRLPSHATMKVHGWTVHLNKALWLEEPKLVAEMLKLLAVQLERVVAAVPAASLKDLREVPLWINPPPARAHPRAEYHPDRDWLREHGREPAMAKAIEITNTKIFAFEHRRMPYLMLHELAHAYHDRVLGFDRPEVRKLYEAARASGGYDRVKRFNGRKIVTDKAYAMSNHKEYFAENSEAYFGRNDFYPFDRGELREHDPAMLRLLEELWKVDGK